ncbi:MAG TPA: methionine--tRNA ligase [Spirochaetia bacterium]|nr:methionine--tRNA ligase [Spirochaetia bacterium]
MERRLITSALPYVNNIPHLGNLIQVLSADVFARYCRLAGYETLYICGTDEYGTATETRALEEGITPRELCDRYHAVHRDIYQWFQIAFDHFGRTSVPVHTEITQHIFQRLHENGYITERVMHQPYCEKDRRFLADRYVLGTCPHCGYADARGDQCENCGKLLDPTELIEPRCSVCSSRPVIRETKHLFIDLKAILPKLRNWIESAAEKGFWARNAIQMTYAWMRDGLKERAITRDLSWGIPVPLDGYRNKVFYVWFDAPIGYISITAELTPEHWKSWWYAPRSVKLFQFIGKDNIPFHTVIFPSSQLGTGEDWTTLYHMSSTEYLNYEGGKFSKSKGVGVFGTDAKETGIPADVWRFYIYYNRPERSDALFTWKDFQEKVNSELIGNLANLVNRTLQFVSRFYQGALPASEPDPDFWTEVRAAETEISGLLEKVELRDAFRRIFALSSFGNKRFQDGEPWKGVKENPQATARLIWNLTYLVRDLSILIRPYLPITSDRIGKTLGLAPTTWKDLGDPKGIERVEKPELLFARLEDKEVEALRQRFSGTQKERAQAAEGAAAALGGTSPTAAPAPTPPSLSPAEISAGFRGQVDLRVARIIEVKRHPKAEKLYIETVDLGTEQRTIVSGLVPFYKEEELLGHNVVLVANLKPAVLRGVESNGMLLAASAGDTVEVLFLDDARPGDRVAPSGAASEPAPAQIDIDRFLSLPITVEDSRVVTGDAALECGGRPLVTARVSKGRVK